MSNDNQAKVTTVLGATGCGKTHYLRGQLGKPKRRRTIIWSPKEPIDNYAAMYAGTHLVRSAGDALKVLKAAGRKGEFHLVFQPRLVRASDEAQFGVVCKAAMQARDVTMVVDEIHTVTRPSWAPDGWSELVMMGRGYGAEIFALSQRPASMDKDLMANSSRIRTGRLAFDEDAKAVAKTLNVRWQDVMALTGFQYIERDLLTGATKRG